MLYTKPKTLSGYKKNGNFEISDFAGFISDLLQRELLVHDAEIGVAKFVEQNGTQDLSEKQSKVLDIIFDKYATEQCARCGLSIGSNRIYR